MKAATNPALDRATIVREGSDEALCMDVIPDFKNKIRYAPYVSFRSQTSHIATNKG